MIDLKVASKIKRYLDHHVALDENDTCTIFFDNKSKQTEFDIESGWKSFDFQNYVIDRKTFDFDDYNHTEIHICGNNIEDDLPFWRVMKFNNIESDHFQEFDAAPEIYGDLTKLLGSSDIIEFIKIVTNSSELCLKYKATEFHILTPNGFCLTFKKGIVNLQ